MKTRVSKPSAVVLGAMLLVSCIGTSHALTGHSDHVILQQTRQHNASGIPVRWVGQIIRIAPARQNTCFYVLGRPSASSHARLQMAHDPMGRFVACSPGFFDPAVYTPGRMIAVVGVLHGAVTRPFGDRAVPHVVAHTVSLWTPSTTHRHESPCSWIDPLWSPVWWGPVWWGTGDH